jgi:hypothetical protein
VNPRCCSRTACKQSPVYTLTYVYRDSTAVLGPLAAYVEPHCYDLCEKHAARLVVPRGWDVLRLPPDPARERADDLEALANVVREAGSAGGAGGAGRSGGQGSSGHPERVEHPERLGQPRPPVAEPVGQGVEVGRRGHLRVLRSATVKDE